MAPYGLAHLLNLVTKHILFIYLTFHCEIFSHEQKFHKNSVNHPHLSILHPHAPNVDLLLWGVNIG